MKRMILVLSFALVSALSAGAQGKSQSAPTAGTHTPASTTHSNVPTSKDREKGTDRAVDAGKGQHKGLKKSKKDKDKKGNTPETSKK
jgi:hypothetical protein